MKTVKNVWLFLISLGISLFLLDVFLYHSRVVTVPFSTTDSIQGRVNLPEKTVVMFNEGLFIGKTNHTGFWTPDYPQQKERNTVRIGLLGNSYVEAPQLLMRDHFRTILENCLNKNIQDEKIEVLNFGRSGADLSDMFYVYNKHAKNYNCDFYLVFLDPYVLTSATGDFAKDSGPYYILQEGALQVNNSFATKSGYQMQQKMNWLLNNSLIFGGLIKNDYDLVKRGEFWPIITDNLFRTTGHKATHTSEQPKIISNIAFSIINAFAMDEKVWFVWNPQNYQGLQYQYNRQLALKADRWISLEPAFKEMRATYIQPNYWKGSKTEGHWNQQAHQFIGEYLAGRLKQVIRKPVMQESAMR